MQTLLFLIIILYIFGPVLRRQRISRIKNLQSIVLVEKMHVNFFYITIPIHFYDLEILKCISTSGQRFIKHSSDVKNIMKKLLLIGLYYTVI